MRAAASTGAVFEAEEVLTIAEEAHRQATGSDLPPRRRRRPARTRPMLWDFDNEDEMQRRLPRLSALFLEPPD